MISRHLSLKNIIGYLLLLSLIFLIFASGVWQYFVSDHQIVTFNLKKNFFAPTVRQIKLEIVKTPTSITAGLSNRHELATFNGERIDGMLFILPRSQQAHFWMKDMRFDLDICWLKNQQIIVCDTARAKQLDGNDQYQIFTSPVPVDSVLEILPNFLTAEEQQLEFYPNFFN